MIQGNENGTGFGQLKDAMKATAGSLAPAADLAKAINDYADHLAGGKPALMNVNGQLGSHWTSEAGGALTKEFSDNLGQPLDDVVAALRSASGALGQLHDTAQQLVGFSIGNALNPLSSGPTSLDELEQKMQPDGPPRVFSGELIKQADDNLVNAGNKLISDRLTPVLDAAVTTLDAVVGMKWAGRQGGNKPQAELKPRAPGAPGGPKSPSLPKGPGGATPPGAKTPGAGDPGSPTAGAPSTGGDPSTGGTPSLGDTGSPSSSDPTSLGDPNASSSNLPDQTPSIPDIPDPSTIDPGNPPPTDPNVNIPNPPPNVPINIPQLAGNPNIVNVPNPSANIPDLKIPDPINLPGSNSPTGGGPLNVPLIPPVGGGSSQSRSSGSSNTTGTQAGNAPRVSGLPNEAAAAANAAKGGGGMPPMYPPPMGGMGGGRGGGGVRPGTADKAGGPELGGLGAAPGKPVEEIGVPARLRGRGAAAGPAGRATRTPRRRTRKSNGAQTVSSAADERGEVLDEQLWRVEPPAMSDE